MIYKNLQIWMISKARLLNIERMTLTQLPKFEMFEEGAQIRKSIKLAKFTILEGYGWRQYEQEFTRFLTYTRASCDETGDHLVAPFETGSLSDQPLDEGPHENQFVALTVSAAPVGSHVELNAVHMY